MLTRPAAGTIPDAPGSYQFKDRDGRVIYVGKAKSLRSRLSNYFVNPALLPDRTRQMVTAAESVEWIEVRNEVEALFLEFNLIKKHKPRFNIRLKDDKSYPYLAVTVGEDWPRAMVMRGAKRKGVRYYGPFAHAYAIRETLDLLLRTFPIRTCTDNKLDRHRKLGRPCLYAHIEKCSAPCVDAITPADYETLVGELLDFLDGHTETIVERLETEMKAAASELEFERAARLRDQLSSVRKAIERQQMVGDKDEDYDAIGLAEDDLEASIQVFNVRRGRMVGRKGLVLEKVEELSPAGAVGPHPGDALRRRPGRGRAQGGADPGRAGGARALRGVPVPRAGLQGADPGAEAGQQAGLPRDRDQERRGGLHPPPPQAGLRPQRPGPGPHRPPGRPRPARGAAADRVLRHLPHHGDGDRRLHGGDGGRAGQAVRLPPVQDPFPRRPGRLRRHERGHHPPVHQLPAGARRRACGPASGSPTRPTSCSSTAGRGSCRRR